MRNHHKRRGKGFISDKIRASGLNDEINNLEEEMHLYYPKSEQVPGGSFNDTYTYSYCGPGTKFVQRIREGYKGVNELDEAARVHDLFYYLYKDVEHRNKADIILMNDCKNILAKYGLLAANIDSDTLSKFDPLTQRLLADTVTVMHIMNIKQRFGL